MPKKRHMEADYCPVEAALNRIGGKWKGLILLRLLGATWRFNALKRSLPGCSERMLIKQLREMEEDGLVVRKAYPEVPPRVEYCLSEAGRGLEPVVRAMCEWGQVYVEGVKPDFRSVLAASTESANRLSSQPR